MSSSEHEEDIFEVERIDKMYEILSGSDDHLGFKVKWKDYDEITEEPESNLIDCQEVIDAFLKSSPAGRKLYLKYHPEKEADFKKWEAEKRNAKKQKQNSKKKNESTSSTKETPTNQVSNQGLPIIISKDGIFPKEIKPNGKEEKENEPFDIIPQSQALPIPPSYHRDQIDDNSTKSIINKPLIETTKKTEKKKDLKTEEAPKPKRKKMSAMPDNLEIKKEADKIEKQNKDIRQKDKQSASKSTVKKESKKQKQSTKSSEVPSRPTSISFETPKSPSILSSRQSSTTLGSSKPVSSHPSRQSSTTLGSSKPVSSHPSRQSSTSSDKQIQSKSTKSAQKSKETTPLLQSEIPISCFYPHASFKTPVDKFTQSHVLQSGKSGYDVTNIYSLDERDGEVYVQVNILDNPERQEIELPIARFLFPDQMIDFLFDYVTN